MSFNSILDLPKPKLRPRNGRDWVERFLTSFCLDPETDCWNWVSPIANGYGQIHILKLGVRAHRLSWIFHNGIIPDGVNVCHKCDNPLCVNPEHLFLGTQKENVMDCVRKNRHSHGGLSPKSKITESQAIKIKELRKIGTPQKVVAEMFGITTKNVSKIFTGRTWSHLP